MEPQTDHKRPKAPDKGFTPRPGKRAVRGRLKSGFWHKSMGLALFYACPYIYHAGAIASYDTPIEEAVLVTGPIILYLIAVSLYMKGASADAD